MTLLAVALGGAFGSLGRWAIASVLSGSASGFPTATFAVNVTGAFGLGVAGAVLMERLTPRPYMRSLIGIGFFGAYTTFSTMAVEGIRLIDRGKPTTALTYWVLTLVVGQMAGVYGMWIGRLELPIGRSRDEHEGRREAAADLHR